MIPYDELVDRTVRWAQGRDWFEGAHSVVLVRDLLGRVRLVVDGPVGTQEEASLDGVVHGWAGGLLSTKGSPDEAAIARQVITDAQPWPNRWGRQVSDGFGGTVHVDSRWRSFERVSGKESWLSARGGAPPWPLLSQTPPIATFYSFKGGVGRTTALVLTAAHLAASGRRVLCIDLDLEAPGLADSVGVKPEAGTLDLLLHHHVHASLEPGVVADTVMNVDLGEQQLNVLPAARIDHSYIERVARLDYLTDHTSDSVSPVEAGVAAILKQARPDYDVILLDARAGIHDLGGLAVLSISHASVIVFRPDLQALAGLELVLPAIAARRDANEQRLVLAASFVPEDVEARSVVLARWRQLVFDRCTMAGSIYDGLDEAPGLDDADLPHDLVALSESGQLSATESLQGHSTPPTALPDYRNLAERLESVLAPEESL